MAKLQLLFVVVAILPAGWFLAGCDNPPPQGGPPSDGIAVIDGSTVTNPPVEEEEEDGDDPRDTPPPTIYGEEFDPAQCPQRDFANRGCTALVVDFSKADWHRFDAEDVKTNLDAIFCDADYVAPRFRPKPRGFVYVGASGDVIVMPPSAQSIAAANTHNAAEWAKVNAAVTAHRTKVQAGTTLAMEIVRGHGGLPRTGRPCGRWGPGFWSGNGLDRHTFLQLNYGATRGNACIWYVADMSCYSGQTPMAMNELNNAGTASCGAIPGDNHGMHAAYEADMSHGSGSPTATTSNARNGWLTDEIEDAIEAEADRRQAAGIQISRDFTDLANDLFAVGSSISTGSIYTDRGTAWCNPPVHSRAGY
jgi:hypothetical protein